jgi:hypothetical protein
MPNKFTAMKKPENKHNLSGVRRAVVPDVVTLILVE